ncbi:uncharacterized protein FIESC28_03209 [Fusarium coffeatum]|uniref:Uncharacterized protein n=1 Tax=Fusarium coffeatum TaxID=231269 RepID=A0A366S3L9_9HYPO|nr:uncharacterized protein FIESC28_03209 [Fusarium coffeatum]RBR23899.1 hypothetical protein FIESC28_03209 [Fusarium coffeatum]
MSRLRNKVLPVLAVSSLPSSHITSGPDISWTKVGSGKDHLLSELESLYWDGVRTELENIVRTLKVWQQPEYAQVTIQDEDDDHIHGFDTFLDQVSHEARAHAIRYGEMREKQTKKKKDWYPNTKPFGTKFARDAVLDSISDRIAQQVSDGIKIDVRREIKAVTKLKGIEQRAWMLLQAAEKLIEHRSPPEMLGLWKRPAIPQLTLSNVEQDGTLNFEPLRCMQKRCKKVIRGSMFVHDKTDSEPGIICEECYRNHYYGKEAYTKAYKHCILSEAITPEMSRKICKCLNLQDTSTGEPQSLFPIEEPNKHKDTGSEGEKCELLQLGDMVALAKYHGLQESVGVKPRSQKDTEKAEKQAKADSRGLSSRFYKNSILNEERAGESDFEAEEELEPGPEAEGRNRRLSALKAVQQLGVSGNVSVAEEAVGDTDIPLFFRKHAEKNPFGNVHMALRVGPLVVENGVSHTKGGALVSLREMPVFQQRFHLHTIPGRELAIGSGSDRLLWQRKREVKDRKRYKAFMKQVIGVPFSGGHTLPHDQELSVVRDLLAACEQQFDDPSLSTTDQLKLLNSALEPVLGKLKALLGSRMKVYLSSIAERLLDKNIKLAWSTTSNNCQTFCSSLIDKNIFGPLVSGEPPKTFTDAAPLYAMSFVCPDEGYKKSRGVRTKFDVPFGLTEEYLLRFHFGRHGEADIIDTYQEYWYDWGAFGSTLYKYQDLYPWDCTEAYGRYPTKCGDCNLAKHVWAFPFDSWSMSSHHLSRDRHMYAPALTDKTLTAVGPDATPSSWMRNRLTVLSAMSTLHRAATAMAHSLKFQKATAWLHKGPSHTLLDPSLKRVKLGGIHRAQPCSHYFEAGVYSHYFIAPWATLTRPRQVEAYEKQRNGRVNLPDVPSSSRKRRFARHIELPEYNYLDFSGQTTLMQLNAANDTAPPFPHRRSLVMYAQAGAEVLRAMRPSVRVERLSEPQRQLRWQKVLHILMEGVILIVEEGLQVVVEEVRVVVEEVRVVVGGAVVEVQVSEGLLVEFAKLQLPAPLAVFASFSTSEPSTGYHHPVQPSAKSLLRA